jgi:parvulin-like peptidyl-prolyl isomerase
MGWIGKGVLPKSLEDILFKLEPGQYSEIIQDHAGDQLVFRILYVEERRNF